METAYAAAYRRQPSMERSRVSVFTHLESEFRREEAATRRSEGIRNMRVT